VAAADAGFGGAARQAAGGRHCLIFTPLAYLLFRKSAAAFFR
jgi:hypothetical protein